RGRTRVSLEQVTTRKSLRTQVSGGGSPASQRQWAWGSAQTGKVVLEGLMSGEMLDGGWGTCVGIEADFLVPGLGDQTDLVWKLQGQEKGTTKTRQFPLPPPTPHPTPTPALQINLQDPGRVFEDEKARTLGQPGPLQDLSSVADSKKPFGHLGPKSVHPRVPLTPLHTPRLSPMSREGSAGDSDLNLGQMCPSAQRRHCRE
ncbi:hypothetical protein P7K49_005987, partial [Saguinus oedipus]